jgi:hypothetical protein
MPLNLSQDHIAQDEIVKFLCRELYPKEQDSIRKKRVRARINDARKRGELAKVTKRKGKQCVHVRTFFEWACTKKGWEVLNTMPGIPRDATVRVTGVEARVEVERSFALGFPDAMDELLEAYKEKQKTVGEIEELKEKLQKKESRSKRATEYGKLGGRPKNYSG